jgi:multiple sugar transport system substrate-binding protein
VPVGAYGSAVSARSRHIDAAKAYVKWLWVGNTADQEDFSLSYGFHIPARISLAKKADKLKEGAAADAVRFTTDYGYAQPLLWTNKSSTAYQDALSRIIKDGADPASQLRPVVATANAELSRVRRA